MATKEFEAYGFIDSPESVSAWLAANCLDAALCSIIVGGSMYNMSTVQLPVQHLQHLSILRLADVRVATTQYSSPHAAAPAEASPHPLGLAPLTALRQLDVTDCDMHLDSLSALTDLQYLAFSASRGVCCQAVSASLQELAVALPALQRLTCLSLAGDLGHDAIVQQVHSLGCLQELYVSCACTVSSFQLMPPSLTKLVIISKDIHNLQLSPSTTPGLCHLTALKKLIVPRTSFSVELLSHMTSLQMLDLAQASLEGPGGLSVLTGLTQLQHLALPKAEEVEPVLQGTAGLAAITASSQLTYLDISTSLESSHECLQAFQGKKLPHLVELRISLPGLSDERTAPLVAKCCPNLLRLWCGSDTDPGEADREAAWSAAGALPGALACWAEPDSTGQGLTSLQLAVAHIDMIEVWPALGCLTQLRSLCVLGAGPDMLPGMLELQDCVYLSELRITTYHSEVYSDAHIRVVSEAAQDGTTCMHEELHKALHSLVLQLEEEHAAHPDLLACVFACDLQVQRYQQQTIADLQKQVADLQQQLQCQQTSAAG